MLPELGFHSWKIVYAIASAQYSWGSKRETIVVKGSKWKHMRKILKCYLPVFSDDEHLTFETTGSPCFRSELYLRRSAYKQIHPCSFCVFIFGLGQFRRLCKFWPGIRWCACSVHFIEQRLIFYLWKLRYFISHTPSNIQFQVITYRFFIRGTSREFGNTYLLDNCNSHSCLSHV